MTNTIYTTRRESQNAAETMTATEMALTSHNLGGKGAAVATTKDGRKFSWMNERNLWVRYK